MEQLEKRRKMAYVLTIVTIVNLWASIACDPGNPWATGAMAMVVALLIGITIERWARFLKLYIASEIDKKIK